MGLERTCIHRAQYFDSSGNYLDEATILKLARDKGYSTQKLVGRQA